MEPYQEKAWDILTQSEKNSLFLQMSQGQSSWEASEILGISHYKYLELKERSIKFFKMFSEYFQKFNTLISPNSVIDPRFRDFIEATIEKRLPKSEVVAYMDDSSLFIRGIKSKFLTSNMKRLLESESEHDNRLYDIIIEFDRWNNQRILPRDLQLPSAYKRRNNKRDKVYISYISNIPQYKVSAIADMFEYKVRSEKKPRYYLTLIDDAYEDGYFIIPVKTKDSTVEKLSQLSLFIFDTKDKADTFGYLVTQFIHKPKTPKSGQEFWSRYRDCTRMAINYDKVSMSNFYAEKLDIAYDMPKRKKKLKDAVKIKPAKRADPELFYSKR